MLAFFSLWFTISLFLIWFENSPCALFLLVLDPGPTTSCSPPSMCWIQICEFAVRWLVHVVSDWMTISGDVCPILKKGQVVSAARLAFSYTPSLIPVNAIERMMNCQFTVPQSSSIPWLVRLTWWCLHIFLSSLIFLHDNALSSGRGNSHVSMKKFDIVGFSRVQFSARRFTSKQVVFFFPLCFLF